MIALVQRVSEASVEIDGETTGTIDEGLLLFLGVEKGDTEREANGLAGRCVRLRIFPDDDGRMDRSVRDVGGEILVVSQFTLCADTDRGNRPSFTRAAPAEHARSLYRTFLDRIEEKLGRPVPSGEFGAMMDVHLVNDGPVTFWMERPSGKSEG